MIQPLPAAQEHVPLAPLTTLRVGGEARWFLRATSVRAIRRALAWAARQGVPVAVMGGGSNMLVPDDGFPGLVLQPRVRGSRFHEDGSVRVGAGVVWDRFVRAAALRGLQGVECLSAIPGHVGAAPVQNIGAYGQDVAATIATVHAIDRASRRCVTFDAADCGFAYRDSRFKRDGDHIITHVTFALRPGAAPEVSYAGLASRLPDSPSLAQVRDAVIAVRREKSMVPVSLAPADDPNRFSAGSWFTNPIVDAATADRVAARVDVEMPRWPAGPGRVKLAAAWLIEQAGFARGFGDGPAGLSTRHTLALVNRGSATANDMLAFERHIRAGVRRAFGVDLQREPVWLAAA